MNGSMLSSSAGDPDALALIRQDIVEAIGPDVDYLKAQESYRPDYQDLVVQVFSSELWKHFVVAGILALAQPIVEGVVRQAGGAVGKLIQEGLGWLKNPSSPNEAAQVTDPFAGMTSADELLDSIMREHPHTLELLVKGGTTAVREGLEKRGFPQPRAAELATLVADQVRQRALALKR